MFTSSKTFIGRSFKKDTLWRSAKNAKTNAKATGNKADAKTFNADSPRNARPSKAATTPVYTEQSETS